ncbi:hypothetical protein Pcinc_035319 [Petrolisthes cinctipes]|uniref:Putative alpha-L-fucosidase n=1 Tax=Petrolisthes cinctipes TaxID=88211 RepID=A0AAE1EPW2_PETCI|nr:hypothetical protein Pcinc_035319 [Petrolisthes cinctipes]
MLKLSFLLCLLGVCGSQYLPDWDSLDSRPLPAWYDEAKVGIFMHWGVYSVPSIGSKGTEWFWKHWDNQVEDYVEFMEQNYPPDFTYQEFAPQFTAELYDPVQWAKVMNASGARYFVITTKHHDGYSLWPSHHSWGWNSMDVGPKRDLIGELVSAVRNTTPHIHVGFYYSQFEWFNPLYLSDASHLFTTNEYVRTKSLPQMYDLVNTYQPDIVWSDGEWDAPTWYWNSTEFIAWLFNESPVKDTVVVNDRWGLLTKCRHGSFYTCQDRYNPGVLQEHKWENAMTIDKITWGYHRTTTLDGYYDPHYIISSLVTTVSCGGNLLLNIGPTHDGRIPPILEERVRQMGQWLEINGDAIYDSKPWTYQNDSVTPDVWYTERGGLVYATVLQWPEEEQVTLGSVTPTVDTTVTMLGYQGLLQFQQLESGISVTFPPLSKVSSEWAWVLVLAGVTPTPR